MKVGFISLGCPKNLVDTEMAIGLFKEKNYIIVNTPEEAEILIINTCGFIEKAKQEGINTILEMAEYKINGKCKFLIVMGCLVQRYKLELIKAIPEVDLFLSIDDYKNMWEKISKLIEKEEKKNNHLPDLRYENRIISTGNKTAYLKIAEGCSNYCTYCAIPYIRGPYASRKMEDILQEAEKLVNSGIQELIVIAQDTTKYGYDLYGEYKLAELLQKLCEIEKVKWIRFLYAYPESITEELIETVKKNEKICKYFDIPIQHISDTILKRMNRRTTGERIKNIVKKIRDEIPDVILRTTLIVGFPGETNSDFEELYYFVQRAKFDKLGVFEYSKEDGTPAAKLENGVHWKTKNVRYKKIMELQQKISKQILEAKLGKKVTALIEGISKDGTYYIARTYMDVPDIDGIMYIKNTENHFIGEFVDCKIAEVKEYDLIAKLCR